MKKLLYLPLLALLLSLQTRASHLNGGELRYEFNGTSYVIHLSLYGDCGGANMANSAVVNVSSVSQSQSFNITLQKVNTKYVTVPCPGGTNKCSNPSSLIPGYYVAEFLATITLPAAASDWVFSSTTSARNSMVNIGGGNLYLEATLNNTNGDNNNAYLPNTPPFYIPTSNTIVVPMQNVDADGDSVVMEKIPAYVAKSTSATYQTGFSAIAPFGSSGIYTLNNTNNTITLRAATTGSHAVAYRMKEYRNGNLIASYTRDFGVAALPGTVTLTFPQMNASSNQVAYACPGTAGTASLSFTDPTSTDSVYITVDTPANLVGWNFNINTNPGSPTASTSISWTAPASLNPSTTPYAYVKLHVRDNACPRNIAEYALLIRIQNCLSDSVWPGDANSDKVVNLLDPLAIAVAYNQTGPTRPNATINWTAQWAQDWSNTYPVSGKNIKHGDCNGDGTVNLNDLGAVVQNWGLTHPKGPRGKKTGVPDLYYDISGVKFAPGATVSVPIKLGTTTDPMNDFYGLGSTVSIGGGIALSSQAAITTNTSWLGNSTNTMEFNKDKNFATVDWAFARIDQQNQSGSGTIATLTFTISSNAKPGETISLDFANTVMVDNTGKQITDFNPVSATATIIPQSVNNITAELEGATIVPNPSGKNAAIRLQLLEETEVHLTITDMAGKILWQHSELASNGAHNISLPAAEFASGIYMVTIASNNNHKVIKWVKQ